jgi:hypothetical protein
VPGTPGEERLICVEKFAYCAQGNCATKNLKTLSPAADSVFSKVFYMVTLYRKCTRALTFQNVLPVGDAGYSKKSKSCI